MLNSFGDSKIPSDGNYKHSHVPQSAKQPMSMYPSGGGWQSSENLYRYYEDFHNQQQQHQQQQQQQHQQQQQQRLEMVSKVAGGGGRCREICCQQCVEPQRYSLNPLPPPSTFRFPSRAQYPMNIPASYMESPFNKKEVPFEDFIPKLSPPGSNLNQHQQVYMSSASQKSSMKVSSQYSNYHTREPARVGPPPPYYMSPQDVTKNNMYNPIYSNSLSLRNSADTRRSKWEACSYNEYTRQVPYPTSDNMPPTSQYNSPHLYPQYSSSFPLQPPPVMNGNGFSMNVSMPAYGCNYSAPPAPAPPLPPPLPTVTSTAPVNKKPPDKKLDIDVREYLATWDDDADDEATVKPAEPEPIVVLDCTALEPDGLAQVREKLKGRSVQVVPSNIGDPKLPYDLGTATIVQIQNPDVIHNKDSNNSYQPLDFTKAINEISPKEPPKKVEFDTLVSYYGDSKKDEETNYDLVQITERFIGSTDKTCDNKDPSSDKVNEKINSQLEKPSLNLIEDPEQFITPTIINKSDYNKVTCNDLDATPDFSSKVLSLPDLCSKPDVTSGYSKKTVVTPDYPTKPLVTSDYSIKPLLTTDYPTTPVVTSDFSTKPSVSSGYPSISLSTSVYSTQSSVTSDNSSKYTVTSINSNTSVISSDYCSKLAATSNCSSKSQLSLDYISKPLVTSAEFCSKPIVVNAPECCNKSLDVPDYCNKTITHELDTSQYFKKRKWYHSYCNDNQETPVTSSSQYTDSNYFYDKRFESTCPPVPCLWESGSADVKTPHTKSSDLNMTTSNYPPFKSSCSHDEDHLKSFTKDYLTEHNKVLTQNVQISPIKGNPLMSSSVSYTQIVENGILKNAPVEDSNLVSEDKRTTICDSDYNICRNPVTKVEKIKDENKNSFDPLLSSARRSSYNTDELIENEKETVLEDCDTPGNYISDDIGKDDDNLSFLCENSFDGDINDLKNSNEIMPNKPIIKCVNVPSVSVRNVRSFDKIKKIKIVNKVNQQKKIIQEKKEIISRMRDFRKKKPPIKVSEVQDEIPLEIRKPIKITVQKTKIRIKSKENQIKYRTQFKLKTSKEPETDKKETSSPRKKRKEAPVSSLISKGCKNIDKKFKVLKKPQQPVREETTCEKLRKCKFKLMKQNISENTKLQPPTISKVFNFCENNNDQKKTNKISALETKRDFTKFCKTSVHEKNTSQMLNIELDEICDSSKLASSAEHLVSIKSEIVSVSSSMCPSISSDDSRSNTFLANDKSLDGKEEVKKHVDSSPLTETLLPQNELKQNSYNTPKLFENFHSITQNTTFEFESQKVSQNFQEVEENLRRLHGESSSQKPNFSSNEFDTWSSVKATFFERTDFKNVNTLFCNNSPKLVLKHQEEALKAPIQTLSDSFKKNDHTEGFNDSLNFDGNTLHPNQDESFKTPDNEASRFDIDKSNQTTNLLNPDDLQKMSVVSSSCSEQEENELAYNLNTFDQNHFLKADSNLTFNNNYLQKVDKQVGIRLMYNDMQYLSSDFKSDLNKTQVQETFGSHVVSRAPEKQVVSKNEKSISDGNEKQSFDPIRKLDLENQANRMSSVNKCIDLQSKILEIRKECLNSHQEYLQSNETKYISNEISPPFEESKIQMLKKDQSFNVKSKENNPIECQTVTHIECNTRSSDCFENFDGNDKSSEHYLDYFVSDESDSEDKTNDSCLSKEVEGGNSIDQNIITINSSSNKLEKSFCHDFDTKNDDLLTENIGNTNYEVIDKTSKGSEDKVQDLIIKEKNILNKESQCSDSTNASEHSSKPSENDFQDESSGEIQTFELEEKLLRNDCSNFKIEKEKQTFPQNKESFNEYEDNPEVKMYSPKNIMMTTVVENVLENSGFVQLNMKDMEQNEQEITQVASQTCSFIIENKLNSDKIDSCKKSNVCDVNESTFSTHKKEPGSDCIQHFLENNCIEKEVKSTKTPLIRAEFCNLTENKKNLFFEGKDVLLSQLNQKSEQESNSKSKELTCFDTFTDIHSQTEVSCTPEITLSPELKLKYLIDIDLHQSSYDPQDLDVCENNNVKTSQKKEKYNERKDITKSSVSDSENSLLITKHFDNCNFDENNEKSESLPDAHSMPKNELFISSKTTKNMEAAKNPVLTKKRLENSEIVDSMNACESNHDLIDVSTKSFENNQQTQKSNGTQESYEINFDSESCSVKNKKEDTSKKLDSTQHFDKTSDMTESVKNNTIAAVFSCKSELPSVEKSMKHSQEKCIAAISTIEESTHINPSFVIDNGPNDEVRSFTEKTKQIQYTAVDNSSKSKHEGTIKRMGHVITDKQKSSVCTINENEIKIDKIEPKENAHGNLIACKNVEVVMENVTLANRNPIPTNINANKEKEEEIRSDTIVCDTIVSDKLVVSKNEEINKSMESNTSSVESLTINPSSNEIHESPEYQLSEKNHLNDDFNLQNNIIGDSFNNIVNTHEIKQPNSLKTLNKTAHYENKPFQQNVDHREVERIENKSCVMQYKFDNSRNISHFENSCKEATTFKSQLPGSSKITTDANVYSYICVNFDNERENLKYDTEDIFENVIKRTEVKKPITTIHKYNREFELNNILMNHKPKCNISCNETKSDQGTCISRNFMNKFQNIGAPGSSEPVKKLPKTYTKWGDSNKEQQVLNLSSMSHNDPVKVRRNLKHELPQNLMDSETTTRLDKISFSAIFNNGNIEEANHQKTQSNHVIGKCKPVVQLYKSDPITMNNEKHSSQSEVNEVTHVFNILPERFSKKTQDNLLCVNTTTNEIDEKDGVNDVPKIVSLQEDEISQNIQSAHDEKFIETQKNLKSLTKKTVENNVHKVIACIHDNDITLKNSEENPGYNGLKDIENIIGEDSAHEVLKNTFPEDASMSIKGSDENNVNPIVIDEIEENDASKDFSNENAAGKGGEINEVSSGFLSTHDKNNVTEEKLQNDVSIKDFKACDENLTNKIQLDDASKTVQSMNKVNVSLLVETPVSDDSEDIKISYSKNEVKRTKENDASKSIESSKENLTSIVLEASKDINCTPDENTSKIESTQDKNVVEETLMDDDSSNIKVYHNNLVYKVPEKTMQDYRSHDEDVVCEVAEKKVNSIKSIKIQNTCEEIADKMMPKETCKLDSTENIKHVYDENVDCKVLKEKVDENGIGKLREKILEVDVFEKNISDEKKDPKNFEEKLADDSIDVGDVFIKINNDVTENVAISNIERANEQPICVNIRIPPDTLQNYQNINVEVEKECNSQSLITHQSSGTYEKKKDQPQISRDSYISRSDPTEQKNACEKNQDNIESTCESKLTDLPKVDDIKTPEMLIVENFKDKSFHDVATPIKLNNEDKEVDLSVIPLPVVDEDFTLNKKIIPDRVALHVETDLKESCFEIPLPPQPPSLENQSKYESKKKIQNCTNDAIKRKHLLKMKSIIRFENLRRNFVPKPLSSPQCKIFKSLKKTKISVSKGTKSALENLESKTESKVNSTIMNLIFPDENTLIPSVSNKELSTPLTLKTELCSSLIESNEIFTTTSGYSNINDNCAKTSSDLLKNRDYSNISQNFGNLPYKQTNSDKSKCFRRSEYTSMHDCSSLRYRSRYPSQGMTVKNSRNTRNETLHSNKKTNLNEKEKYIKSPKKKEDSSKSMIDYKNNSTKNEERSSQRDYQKNLENQHSELLNKSVESNKRHSKIDSPLTCTSRNEINLQNLNSNYKESVLNSPNNFLDDEDLVVIDSWSDSESEKETTDNNTVDKNDSNTSDTNVREINIKELEISSVSENNSFVLKDKGLEGDDKYVIKNNNEDFMDIEKYNIPMNDDEHRDTEIQREENENNNIASVNVEAKTHASEHFEHKDTKQAELVCPEFKTAQFTNETVGLISVVIENASNMECEQVTNSDIIEKSDSTNENEFPIFSQIADVLAGTEFEGVKTDVKTCDIFLQAERKHCNFELNDMRAVNNDTFSPIICDKRINEKIPTEDHCKGLESDVSQHRGETKVAVDIDDVKELKLELIDSFVKKVDTSNETSSSCTNDKVVEDFTSFVKKVDSSNETSSSCTNDKVVEDFVSSKIISQTKRSVPSTDEESDSERIKIVIHEKRCKSVVEDYNLQVIHKSINKQISTEFNENLVEREYLPTVQLNSLDEVSCEKDSCEPSNVNIIIDENKFSSADSVTMNSSVECTKDQTIDHYLSDKSFKIIEEQAEKHIKQKMGVELKDIVSKLDKISQENIETKKYSKSKLSKYKDFIASRKEKRKFLRKGISKADAEIISSQKDFSYGLRERRVKIDVCDNRRSSLRNNTNLKRKQTEESPFMNIKKCKVEPIKTINNHNKSNICTVETQKHASNKPCREKSADIEVKGNSSDSQDEIKESPGDSNLCTVISNVDAINIKLKSLTDISVVDTDCYVVINNNQLIEKTSLLTDNGSNEQIHMKKASESKNSDTIKSITAESPPTLKPFWDEKNKMKEMVKSIPTLKPEQISELEESEPSSTDPTINLGNTSKLISAEESYPIKYTEKIKHSGELKNKDKNCNKEYKLSRQKLKLLKSSKIYKSSKLIKSSKNDIVNDRKRRRYLLNDQSEKHDLSDTETLRKQSNSKTTIIGDSAKRSQEMKEDKHEDLESDCKENLSISQKHPADTISEITPSVQTDIKSQTLEMNGHEQIRKCLRRIKKKRKLLKSFDEDENMNKMLKSDEISKSDRIVIQKPLSTDHCDEKTRRENCEKMSSNKAIKKYYETNIKQLQEKHDEKLSSLKENKKNTRSTAKLLKSDSKEHVEMSINKIPNISDKKNGYKKSQESEKLEGFAQTLNSNSKNLRSNQTTVSNIHPLMFKQNCEIKHLETKKSLKSISSLKRKLIEFDANLSLFKSEDKDLKSIKKITKKTSGKNGFPQCSAETVERSEEKSDKNLDASMKKLTEKPETQKEMHHNEIELQEQDEEKILEEMVSATLKPLALVCADEKKVKKNHEFSEKISYPCQSNVVDGNYNIDIKNNVLIDEVLSEKNKKSLQNISSDSVVLDGATEKTEVAIDMIENVEVSSGLESSSSTTFVDNFVPSSENISNYCSDKVSLCSSDTSITKVEDPFALLIKEVNKELKNSYNYASKITTLENKLFAMNSIVPNGFLKGELDDAYLNCDELRCEKEIENLLLSNAPSVSDNDRVRELSPFSERMLKANNENPEQCDPDDIGLNLKHHPWQIRDTSPTKHIPSPTILGETRTVKCVSLLKTVLEQELLNSFTGKRSDLSPIGEHIIPIEVNQSSNSADVSGEKYLPSLTLPSSERVHDDTVFLNITNAPKELPSFSEIAQKPIEVKNIFSEEEKCSSLAAGKKDQEIEPKCYRHDGRLEVFENIIEGDEHVVNELTVNITELIDVPLNSEHSLENTPLKSCEVNEKTDTSDSVRLEKQVVYDKEVELSNVSSSNLSKYEISDGLGALDLNEESERTRSVSPELDPKNKEISSLDIVFNNEVEVLHSELDTKEADQSVSPSEVSPLHVLTEVGDSMANVHVTEEDEMLTSSILDWPYLEEEVVTQDDQERKAQELPDISEMKIKLPWSKIFDLEKEKETNEAECQQRSLELGPVEIKLQLNSFQTSCLKVKRLILQKAHGECLERDEYEEIRINQPSVAMRREELVEEMIENQVFCLRLRDVVSCDFCGRKLMSQDFLSLHLREFHELHTCPACDETFSGRLLLLAHTSCHRERHHCLLCNRIFSTADKFKQHEESSIHRQLESVQRQTIHVLYRFLSGRDCTVLEPLSSEEIAHLRWQPSDESDDAIHYYHPTPLHQVLQGNLEPESSTSSSCSCDKADCLGDCSRSL